MVAIMVILIFVWYLIVPVFIAFAVCEAIHDRRCPLMKPSSCSVCSYSLEGLTTTVCPECGTDSSFAAADLSERIRSVRSGITLRIGRVVLAMIVGALPFALSLSVRPYPRAFSQWVVDSSWMLLLLLLAAPIFVSIPHAIAAVVIAAPKHRPLRIMPVLIVALWTSIFDGLVYWSIFLIIALQMI